MLTDTMLRNLKPKEKGYKVSDRDGLYVYVLTSGTISFRYNYAINGRQETLVIVYLLACVLLLMLSGPRRDTLIRLT
jgi:hypothetical protein